MGLLANKLNIEECPHWLEGDFGVFTDHKNLEYLYDAKQLNSR